MYDYHNTGPTFKTARSNRYDWRKLFNKFKLKKKPKTRDDLDVDTIGGAVDMNLALITGRKLLYNQMLATWMKLYLVWSRSWAMVLLQFLAPVLLINSTLALIFYATRTSEIIDKRAFVLTKGLDFHISYLFNIVE